MFQNCKNITTGISIVINTDHISTIEPYQCDTGTEYAKIIMNNGQTYIVESIQLDITYHYKEFTNEHVNI